MPTAKKETTKKPATKKHVAKKSAEKKTATKPKTKKYVEGVGRRKTAVARVRITPSDKKKHSVTINGRIIEQYFPQKEHRDLIFNVLTKVEELGEFDITVKVNGSGVSAQAQAIVHGLARALVAHNADIKKKLKIFGFLTRDPRMVERKKYGLKKARRAPQWSKR